jgi:hypothetical protein
MSKTAFINILRKKNEKLIQKLLTMESPTSIIPSGNNNDDHDNNNDNISDLKMDETFTLPPSSYNLDLEEFVKLIPDTIRNSNNSDTNGNGSLRNDDTDEATDPIAALFR